MFSMWIHTQFVKSPPPDMCGTSRVLSAEECRLGGVPEGTLKTTFRKHEVDGAAADRKNVKFDEEFAVSFYLLELEGEVGEGGDVGRSAKKGSKAGPLYREKEAYKIDCEKRAIKGGAQITFEEWLLNEREEETAKLRIKMHEDVGLSRLGSAESASSGKTASRPPMLDFALPGLEHPPGEAQPALLDSRSQQFSIAVNEVSPPQSGSGGAGFQRRLLEPASGGVSESGGLPTGSGPPPPGSAPVTPESRDAAQASRPESLEAQSGGLGGPHSYSAPKTSPNMSLEFSPVLTSAKPEARSRGGPAVLREASHESQPGEAAVSPGGVNVMSPVVLDQAVDAVSKNRRRIALSPELGGGQAASSPYGCVSDGTVSEAVAQGFERIRIREGNEGPSGSLKSGSGRAVGPLWGWVAGAHGAVPSLNSSTEDHTTVEVFRI